MNGNKYFIFISGDNKFDETSRYFFLLIIKVCVRTENFVAIRATNWTH